MSHTPGPWINRGGLILVDDGAAFNSPQVGDAFKTEDANLIAAAPDLLGALKVALDDIEHLLTGAAAMGWTTDNEAATVRRGRAAIVKATGDAA